jgi:hypothetical protein
VPISACALRAIFLIGALWFYVAFCGFGAPVGPIQLCDHYLATIRLAMQGPTAGCKSLQLQRVQLAAQGLQWAANHYNYSIRNGLAVNNNSFVVLDTSPSVCSSYINHATGYRSVLQLD